MDITKKSKKFRKGYRTGHAIGYDAGHQTGWDNGYNEGWDDGYDKGRADTVREVRLTGLPDDSQPSPSGVDSVEALAKRLGVTLFPWQTYLVRKWLGQPPTAVVSDSPETTPPPGSLTNDSSDIGIGIWQFRTGGRGDFIADL